MSTDALPLCVSFDDLEPLEAGTYSDASGDGFFLGLLIAIAASGFQALGMNWQRLAHMREQAKPESERLPVYKVGLWYAGLFLYLGSQLGGQPLALIFLTPAVLAPLGSVTLVFNMLFAWYFTNDRPTLWHLGATILIAGGSVLVALFGYAPDGRYELSELIALFGKPTMIAYIVIVACLGGLLFLFARYLRWSCNNFEDRHRALSRFTREHMTTMLGLTYAALGGILASSTLLLGKVGMELIITTIFEGENQFVYAGTYLILTALLVLGVGQMVFLNKAFGIASATVVVPVFFCFFSTLAMIESMVYFDQWACFGTSQSILICLGVILILSGVLLISRPTAAPKAQLLVVPDSMATEQEMNIERELEDEEDESEKLPFLRPHIN